jgi:hypothetical protein
VVPNVSGLTYKSRAKWKMLRRIYSAIYGETILKNNKVVLFLSRHKVGQAGNFWTLSYLSLTELEAML